MEALKAFSDLLAKLIDKGAVFLYVLAASVATYAVTTWLGWNGYICFAMSCFAGALTWNVHDYLIRRNERLAPDSVITDIHYRIQIEREFLLKKYGYEFRISKDLPCINEGLKSFEEFCDKKISVIESLNTDDNSKGVAIRTIEKQIYKFQDELQREAYSRLNQGRGWLSR